MADLARRGRPIFFQHLRKTGGTSLVDTLKLFFHDDRVAAVDHLAPEQSIGQALEALRGFDLSYGHAEFLSSAPPESFRFAFFRQPFARLLSERRQWMQAQAENIAAAPADVGQALLALQKYPFTEILPRVFDFPVTVPSFWNHQTVMLGAWPMIRETSRVQHYEHHKHSRLISHFESGQAFRNWLLSNRGEILRRAVAAMRGLNFVGLTENLDADTCEVFARLGLPEPGTVVQRNARSAFEDEADPALPDIASEFIELDLQLYEAARERHALQGRIARGTPLDYIGRWLSREETLVVLAQEPPGGHGWYPPHRRGDSNMSRWTGPGLQSRFALSAPAGWYRMTVGIHGAANGRSFLEAKVSVEGLGLVCKTGNLPSGVHTLTVDFERRACGVFDVLFDFPDVGSEFALEVKQIAFEPLPEPPERA